MTPAQHHADQGGTGEVWGCAETPSESRRGRDNEPCAGEAPGCTSNSVMKFIHSTEGQTVRFHLSPFCWEGRGAARRAANVAENKTVTATQLHGSSQIPLTFLIFLL